jgi:hypothetical protein
MSATYPERIATRAELAPVAEPTVTQAADAAMTTMNELTDMVKQLAVSLSQPALRLVRAADPSLKLVAELRQRPV